jgi:alanyl-tRNA synthetase
VKKTGDIKRFAILEDAALAKGIRRVVAVTGDEAARLHRVAQEYSDQVQSVSKLQGSELGKALKSLGKELDAAVIPALVKAQLRDNFASIKKRFDDADKARKAAETKEVNIAYQGC